MLEAKGLKKSYNGKNVLDNIEFYCKRGEFHAIIGPSGAGKTTLLKILAGLENPDLGGLYLDGELLELPNNKLVKGYEEIRLVHQDYALKPNMTVHENLNYALLGYNETYKTDRIDYLSRLCKLEAFMSQPSETLSGGQKQRVAIARALATEPEVVLMDEPFSNLDPTTKYELLHESKRIAEESETAILLVTHDTRDALEVGNRIHILMNGGFVQQGNPIDIYRSPNNLEIAKLLGYINQVGEKAIWAEKIRLGQGSYQGKVNQTIFKGPYQLVEIESQKFGLLLAFDFHFQYNLNQILSFDFDSEDLITFNS